MSKRKRNKLCPVCCEGQLRIADYPQRKAKITYIDKYFECDYCDYSERIKSSGNRSKEIFGG